MSNLAIKCCNLFLLLAFLLLKKTILQRLTQVFEFGALKFRYVSLAVNSDGDLLMLSTRFTGTKERKFFGIKSNGKFYFENNSPFFTTSIAVDDSDSCLSKYESTTLFISMNKTIIKDYFLDIPNYCSYTSLFDFENNNIYIKQTKSIIGVEINTYTLFSFIIKGNSDINYFMLFYIMENTIITHIIYI